MIDHERLKKLRKEKYTTLSKAAKASGVNVSHLSDIEHGKCVPKLCTLHSLLKAYEYKLVVNAVKTKGDTQLVHKLC